MTMSETDNPIDSAFRDPVEILKGALAHLERTHGTLIAHKSQAWEIVDSCREELEKGCIADLIGDKGRAIGAKCDCRRHPGWLEAHFDGMKPKAPNAEFNAAMLKLDAQSREAESDTVSVLDMAPPKARCGKHSITGKEAASGEKEEE
jgi:hypothetical protein